MNFKSATKVLDTAHIKNISQYAFTRFLNQTDQKIGDDVFKLKVYGPDCDLLDALFHELLNFNIDFKKQSLLSVHQVPDSKYSAIIPDLIENVENSQISIVIGHDKTTLKSVFDSFQFSQAPFSLSMAHPSTGKSDDLSTELIELCKPYLYNLGIIGHQSHLSNNIVIYDDPSIGIYTHRLGDLRDKINACEPIIRSSDIFAINLNALKFSEAPNQSDPQPIGFTLEEACQLAYYAGRSERNKVFCIWGIDNTIDQQIIGLRVINTLWWYFLYGIEFRLDAYPPVEEKMTSYTLDTPIEGMYLAFYKDDSQQKWWLKNPVNNSALSSHHPFIACDYEDYSLAVNQQELSDRLQITLAPYQKFELD